MLPFLLSAARQQNIGFVKKQFGDQDSLICRGIDELSACHSSCPHRDKSDHRETKLTHTNQSYTPVQRRNRPGQRPHQWHRDKSDRTRTSCCDALLPRLPQILLRQSSKKRMIHYNGKNKIIQTIVVLHLHASI